MRSPPVRCHAFIVFVVLQLGSFAADELSLSIVSNVSHIVGYEAESPFEHVVGSACCLDLVIEATGTEACESYCAEEPDCGSFWFKAEEGQCYLMSHGSNFEPAIGPHACERRCVDEKSCEAFVFAPSTQLCFLVRFAGEVSQRTQASVKQADDRVFGLVRDTSSGTIQAEISRAFLGDGGRSDLANISAAAVGTHTGTMSEVIQGLPQGYGESAASLHGRLMSVLTAFVLAALVAVARLCDRYRCLVPAGQFGKVCDLSLAILKRLRNRGALPCKDENIRLGLLVQSAMPSACSPDDSAADLSPLSPCRGTIPMEVDGANTSETPASKMVESPESAEKTFQVLDTDVFDSSASILKEPCRECTQVVTTPKADFTWREREATVPKRRSVDMVGATAYPVFLPDRRDVDMVGVTNYPVPDEASPHARGAPRKLVEADRSPSAASTEASPNVTANAESPETSLEDASSEPVRPAASISATLSIWILESMLLLSTLLCGAFMLEPRTFAMIILSLCLAIPLGWRLPGLWHSEQKCRSFKSATLSPNSPHPTSILGREGGWI